MQSLCSNADSNDVASQVVDDLEANFPEFEYFAMVCNAFSNNAQEFSSLLVTDNDYESQQWRGEGEQFDICNHRLFIWRCFCNLVDFLKLYNFVPYSGTQQSLTMQNVLKRITPRQRIYSTLPQKNLCCLATMLSSKIQQLLSATGKKWISPPHGQQTSQLLLKRQS